MLTVVTPTGARPVAFALCAKMMARQDYAGSVRWIVVDDGELATSIADPCAGWSQYVLRPTPAWRPGDNTQARNLAEALDAAERLREPGEDLRILVVEDDDWYDPTWLSRVARWLDAAELVGESHARYYNVALRRGAELGNAFHASLRASAMRGRALVALRRALAEFSTCYDFKLWRDPEPTKRLFDTRITVGMKGLPGRPGIAAGHRDIGGRRDPDLALLRNWIGADADLYAEFLDEEAMNKETTTVYATGRLKTYKTRRLVAGDAFEVSPQEARAYEKLKFATQSPPAAAPAPTVPDDLMATSAAAAPEIESAKPPKRDKRGKPQKDDESAGADD